jgi:hypothetical protein
MSQPTNENKNSSASRRRVGRPPRTYRHPACLQCSRQFVAPMRARPGLNTGPGSLCDACWTREYRLRRRVAGLGTKSVWLKRCASEPLPLQPSSESRDSSDPLQQLPPQLSHDGDRRDFSNELGQLREQFENQAAELRILRHGVDQIIEELRSLRSVN